GARPGRGGARPPPRRGAGGADAVRPPASRPRRGVRSHPPRLPPGDAGRPVAPRRAVGHILGGHHPRAARPAVRDRRRVRSETQDRQKEPAMIADLLRQRILILDGAMGTMLQRHGLGEADFRGERFRDHPHDLKGNFDILNLTRPDAVRAVHEEYLAAGADIIETNTFSAQAVSQADYRTEAFAREINAAAARVARAAADAFSTPARPRFVAGAMGPMNKTLSLSPRVNEPGYRAVTFAEVRDAYADQARGLLHRAVDLLPVQPIFHT